MARLRVAAHVALQRDVEVLDGFENQLQLVGHGVLLVLPLAAFFQLDDFHTVHPSVRSAGRVARPAAGNVVVEVTARILQIVRHLVVLARPAVGQVDGQPFGRFCREFAAQGVAVVLVLAVAQQTVLVQEVTADHVGQFLRAAADADVVFLRGYVAAEHFFKPVCVGKGAAVGQVAVVRAHYRTIIFRCGGIRELAGLPLPHFLDGFLGEHVPSQSLVEVVGEINGVGHLRHTRRAGEADVARIVHARLACLAALRGNQDNAECASCTVNRRSGCVLQYGHGLDVVRVQGVHVAFHAVNQYQRLGA